MPQGNTAFRRTVNKSKSWWKHGKHKGSIEACVQSNRDIALQSEKKKVRGEMFPTVKAAFTAAKNAKWPTRKA